MSEPDSDFDIQEFLAEHFPPIPNLPPRPPARPAPPPPAPDSPPAILARLIYFGTAPKPQPDWPPEWQQAYQIVSEVRGSLHDRMDAFENFIQDRPNYVPMHFGVTEASPVRANRSDRMRFVFDAADSFRISSPLDWVVADLFARPSVNLLVGDPGTKKTLLALDLAVNVASGTPWLGHSIGIAPLSIPSVISSEGASHLFKGAARREIPLGSNEESTPLEVDQPASESTAVPVLLIDEETGKPRLLSRVRGAMLAHNAPRDIPFHFMSLPSFDLAKQQDLDELQKHAESVNAGLLIIDALTDVLRGHNENTVLSVDPIFSNLRTLAEKLHAAILIIHHNNKSGTIRGSSVLAAAVDLLLSIESPADSDLIYLRPLKTREAAPKPITARIHFAGSQFHLTQTDEVPTFAMAEATIKSEILAYLRKHGSATIGELMGWLSENAPGAVRNAVWFLVANKTLRRVNTDEKNKAAIFELAQKVDPNGRA